MVTLELCLSSGQTLCLVQYVLPDLRSVKIAAEIPLPTTCTQEDKDLLVLALHLNRASLRRG